LESIQNSEKQIASLSGLRLNVYVMLLTIPLWFAVSGSYVVIYGGIAYAFGILKLLNYKIFILLFLGILIHELLHALTWMVLQKEGFQQIKFGFNLKALTPYTHYKKAIKMWKYRWGGAVPGLFMGFIPLIISFIIGNASLNFIGFLFTWAALGDVISLWMTRKYNGSQLVQDNPNELGVIVIN